MATTATPAANPNDLTWEICNAINQFRAVHGLPMLAHDAHLTLYVARPHAAEMAARKLATHDRLSGVKAGEQIAAALGRAAAEGEVVAVGQPDAVAAVAAWEADAAHLADLLGPFALVGAGVAFDAAGVPYWCADLSA